MKIMRIEKEDKAFVAKIRWDFDKIKVIIFEKNEKLTIKSLKKEYPSYELLKIEQVNYVRR